MIWLFGLVGDNMKVSSVSLVGMLGVLGNLFLMVIKLGSGIIFASQAMIADGINSTMDIFASLMTLMGGHISLQPRDKDHQFGHGKAEFLFSFLVSISMILAAFYIFMDALKGLLQGHEIAFSFLLIVVCLITILVKFGLYIYSRKIYQKTKNLLVYSNMLDHRNDMIVTSFTLLSVLFSSFNVSFLDSLVGLGISFYIFYSGALIFLDSYHVLMDKALPDKEAKKIQDFILKQKKVEGITKFETVPAGAQYILVLSILVDGNLSTFESHKIADTLEKDLLKNFAIILTSTIHVNPIEVKKKKTRKK